jgi:hypothetical protein
VASGARRRSRCRRCACARSWRAPTASRSGVAPSLHMNAAPALSKSNRGAAANRPCSGASAG